MRVWRCVDHCGDFLQIAEVNEIGQFRQWCEDHELAWNIRRTTIYAMGWAGVRQFLQECGKLFKEVQENG